MIDEVLKVALVRAEERGRAAAIARVIGADYGPTGLEIAKKIAHLIFTLPNYDGIYHEAYAAHYNSLVSTVKECDHDSPYYNDSASAWYCSRCGAFLTSDSQR